jgi:hypothetical protein
VERSANICKAMERCKNAGTTDVRGEELSVGTDADGFILPYQAILLNNI